MLLSSCVHAALTHAAAGLKLTVLRRRLLRAGVQQPCAGGGTGASAAASCAAGRRSLARGSQHVRRTPSPQDAQAEQHGAEEGAQTDNAHQLSQLAASAGQPWARVNASCVL